MTSGWSGGRNLRLSAMALAVAFVVLYGYWWHSIEGPWAPIGQPRYVQLAELVPIVAGIVAFYGVLPRVDWIDCQSPRCLRAYDTLGAVTVLFGCAMLPVAVRWLWARSTFYTLFLGEFSRLNNPEELSEVAPYSVFIGYGGNILLMLSLTCLSIAILGRTLGPIGGIIAFIAFITAQGYGVVTLFPGRGASHLTLTATDAAVLGLVVPLCLAAYYATAAGTRPAIGIWSAKAL